MDGDGHVLTVRERLVWPLLEVLYPGTRGAFGLPESAVAGGG